MWEMSIEEFPGKEIRLETTEIASFHMSTNDNWFLVTEDHWGYEYWFLQTAYGHTKST